MRKIGQRILLVSVLTTFFMIPIPVVAKMNNNKDSGLIEQIGQTPIILRGLEDTTIELNGAVFGAEIYDDGSDGNWVFQMHEYYTHELISYDSGVWENAIPDGSGFNIQIYTELIFLELGLYDISFNIIDSDDNIVFTNAILEVVDTQDPTLILRPEDPTYYFHGMSGNTLTWVFEDYDPYLYGIGYYDVFTGDFLGLWESGEWESNIPIVVSLDGLDMGGYIFIISIVDESGNFYFDVINQIWIINPSISYRESQDPIYVGDTTTISVESDYFYLFDSINVEIDGLLYDITDSHYLDWTSEIIGEYSYVIIFTWMGGVYDIKIRDTIFVISRPCEEVDIILEVKALISGVWENPNGKLIDKKFYKVETTPIPITAIYDSETETIININELAVEVFESEVNRKHKNIDLRDFILSNYEIEGISYEIL